MNGVRIQNEPIAAPLDDPRKRFGIFEYESIRLANLKISNSEIGFVPSIKLPINTILAGLGLYYRNDISMVFCFNCGRGSRLFEAMTIDSLLQIHSESCNYFSLNNIIGFQEALVTGLLFTPWCTFYGAIYSYCYINYGVYVHCLVFVPSILVRFCTV